MDSDREYSFEIGVVHGRFQIFHFSHLKYVLAAKKQCKQIVIGITNPERSSNTKGSVDENRFAISSNPFTFFERMLMIRECLIREGLNQSDFFIVPFPIEEPERIANYVPENAQHFLTIYDDWGRQKLDRLRKAGFNVKVLWEKTTADKIHVASKIRKLITDKMSWNDQVPEAVFECIVSRGWDMRFRSDA